MLLKGLLSFRRKLNRLCNYSLLMKVILGGGEMCVNDGCNGLSGGPLPFEVEVVDAVSGPGGYLESVRKAASCQPAPGQGQGTNFPALTNLLTNFSGFNMAVCVPRNSGNASHHIP